MLYKGKRDGYYLYELTDTDLIWEEQDQDRYLIGNVLLFANKNDIALGRESIKADDLATALDYLKGDVEFLEETGGPQQEIIASLKSQLAESEAKTFWLDGLLHDLTADLESQRYSNQMLIAQLESLREQISIEQLSRNEVMGDLELASAETYRMDKELQEAIDAKSQLEQELAERICELLELDSANHELQNRLHKQGFEDAEVVMHKPDDAHLPLRSKTRSYAPEAQVFTTSTGKLIQVYHEFPVSKNKVRRRGISAIQGFVRVVGLIALGILIFIAGSVLATARLNGLSLGEALDLTLKTLLP